MGLQWIYGALVAFWGSYIRAGPFCQEKPRYDVYESTFHHFVNDKSDTNTSVVG